MQDQVTMYKCSTCGHRWTVKAAPDAVTGDNKGKGQNVCDKCGTVAAPITQ